MKKEILAAAGLSAGLVLGACASEETHQNVAVNGWDIIQEADIMEHGWVGYRRQSRLPSGELRNIHSYDVQVGSTCVSYDENFNCRASVPVYDDRYDYERKEEVVAVECDQEPVFSEYAKSEVSKDQSCWDSVGPNQWLVQKPAEFVVRVVIDGGKGSYNCSVTVSEEMYYKTAEQRNGLVAKERGGCKITSLEYPEE